MKSLLAAGLVLLLAGCGHDKPPVTPPSDDTMHVVSTHLGGVAVTVDSSDWTPYLDIRMMRAVPSPALSPSAAYQRATDLCAAKHFEQAASLLRQELERGHGDVETRRLLARALLQVGKLADAEAQCREIVRMQPTAAAYNNLGLVLFARRQFVDSEAAYRTALRLDSKNFVAGKNLGNLLFLRGDHAAAEREWLRLASLYPLDSYPYTSLYFLYVEDGRLTAAEEVCRYVLAQPLSTQPGTARRDYYLHMRARLAMVLMARGADDEAAQHLGAVVKSADFESQENAWRATVYTALGDLLQRKGDGQRALPAYQQASRCVATGSRDAADLRRKMHLLTRTN